MLEHVTVTPWTIRRQGVGLPLGEPVRESSGSLRNMGLAPMYSWRVAFCDGCRWGLTFELSGRRRQDVRARPGKMYRVPQAGP